MARTIAALSPGSRITDYISLGVTAKYFPATTVDAILSDACKASISLRPGQVFGEMSLLSGMPISATVVAARDTRVHALQEITP